MSRRRRNHWRKGTGEAYCCICVKWCVLPYRQGNLGGNRSRDRTSGPKELSGDPALAAPMMPPTCPKRNRLPAAAANQGKARLTCVVDAGVQGSTPGSTMASSKPGLPISDIALIKGPQADH